MERAYTFVREIDSRVKFLFLLECQTRWQISPPSSGDNMIHFPICKLPLQLIVTQQSKPFRDAKICVIAPFPRLRNSCKGNKKSELPLKRLVHWRHSVLILVRS